MKGVSPSYTANYCGLAELQTKQDKTKQDKTKQTRSNLINHNILSHSAQLSYMLGTADYPADYLIDLFHSSYSCIHPSVQSLFCQEM